MKELIQQFAFDYERDCDGRLSMEDEQRSIQHPVVFLFIGEKSATILERLAEGNDMEWNNAKAVPYIHVTTKETVARDNVYSFAWELPPLDKKSLRPEIHRAFLQTKEPLIQLNRLIRRVSGHLSQHGSSYSSVQTLNVAVVTQADDALNVLLPELVLLVTNILQESYKNVQMDLYVLLQEWQQEAHSSYAQALACSFLHELDGYQQQDYHFSAPLLVTEDGIELPVEHKRGPLFNLAYVLGDKDEHGVLIANQPERQSRLISKLVLLKNQTPSPEPQQSDRYNRMQFWRSVTTADRKPAYASAGLARLKRPNQAIAITVLDAVYKRMLERMEDPAEIDRDWLRAILGLDAASLDRRVQSALPEVERLEEMHGLMSYERPYRQISELTVKQAELELFAGSAQQFFERHFVERARSGLALEALGQRLRQRLEEAVVADERYGLFAAYELTGESDQGKGLLADLQKALRDTGSQLERAKAELADFYQQPAYALELPKLGWFARDKQRLQQFNRELLTQIYERKYEILYLELLQTLLEASRAALYEAHQEYRKRVEQLYEFRKLTGDIATDSVRRASADIGRNIPEYYGAIVSKLLDSLETKYGPRFYFSERFSLQPVWEGEAERSWLDRFTMFCRTQLMTQAPFQQSFEEELLQRTNVMTEYGNQQVLTRGALFAELFRRMEEEAAIRVQLLQFTQKHRYEEAYYFGDTQSEWVRYALERDRELHAYKLGCIHQHRSSGIEKVRLMGGFHLENLQIYQIGRKYYESYQENGYCFHPEQPSIERGGDGVAATKMERTDDWG